jgi:hypothetical protein
VRNVKIDPEFRDRIPPLSDDEKAQLEESLLRDGCLSPLVVWEGAEPTAECKHCDYECHGYEPDYEEVGISGIVKWVCRNCGATPFATDVLLLDGHHRIDICRQHGIDFETVDVEIEDREAALDWIDRNQLGRRNLAPDQASLVRGRIYNGGAHGRRSRW